MSPPPTVLILTYPEHGQANMNLATSYELALAGANVHIASFAALGTRVVRLQELIDRHASRSSGKPTGSVSFHECRGITPNWEAQERHGVHAANLPHPCGVVGAVEGYSKIGAALYHWSQEEYLAVIAVVKEIIATTKPDVVGVDPLFFAAQDACRLAGQKFMIMSPTGLKESGTASVQPNLAVFWKYPVLASGFSYPLKWWLIPLNIYLFIRLILTSVNSVNIKQTQALRKSLGLKSLGYKSEPGVPFICPALPEIDFLFPIIPEEIVLCGPIIVPFDPLEESDLALMKWLDNGPTVLINLGSHVVADGKLAREIVSAFRILLDYHDKKGGSSKIQVLWKVKADGNIQKVIDEIVGKEIKEGRIKVVAWLDAEPVSILQHPNVVCTVHHGGANSFYEGVWSGVPHIVLPVWFDTYDYATRAEYLNIGIFGNKTSSPGVRAEEFGKALVRVTGDSKEAVKFRTSARRLKDVCREKGNGREIASVAILKEAGIRK
ncbi:UDP-Glycosyltransferase/glycogen phosphorylase [Imleria badia]|nr:UDP-Glycosyltransferase/glycogen phosphorylase [Imleria badia]